MVIQKVIHNLCTEQTKMLKRSFIVSNFCSKALLRKPSGSGEQVGFISNLYDYRACFRVKIRSTVPASL